MKNTETIKESFVSNDTALLLREHGFHEPTQYYYESEKYLSSWCVPFDWNSGRNGKRNLSAPTQQMVGKWLRVKHGIHVLIDVDDLGWCFVILDIANRDENGDPKQLSPSHAGYNSFEEAFEEGIVFAVEQFLEKPSI